MNEKDKAKLTIQIANEEYRDPDFGFSDKDYWIAAFFGFLLGLAGSWFIMWLISR